MNEKNLKPMNQRTKSEARELGKKGGQASGRSRRKKADLRKLLQAALNSPFDVDGQTMTGAEMVIARLMDAANNPESRNFGKAIDTILKLTEEPTALDGLRLEQAALRVKSMQENIWSSQTYEPDPFTKSIQERVRKAE